MSGVPPLPLRFVTSASDVSTLPESEGEMAFVGRSNVGKSSLVNALANRRQLARVSKTPGRTQLINLFSLHDGHTLVDLPGYGYAAAPKTERRRWGPMTERYLLERSSLRCVGVLVDGEIGPTPLDTAVLDWLRDVELGFRVIATKFDKVKASKRPKRRRDLAAGCGLLESDVTWVSASTGVNIELLRGRIIEWTRDGPPPIRPLRSPTPTPR
ncbi:MAG: ribosome biogenesis GTP-binding protein YihA/YsxC [Microthrixaceae bacterium]